MSGVPAQVEATFWLLEAPDSLAMQSRREPDGTGLGIFDHERARVVKQAIAAYEDRAFAEEARSVRSTTFIAHVRFASTGGLDTKNTHPFDLQNRLFAHNGVIGDLARLERELGSCPPTACRPTRRRPSSCGASCATASAMTWPTSCWPTSTRASPS
jgi:Predicted glutamine amidotransferase